MLSVPPVLAAYFHELSPFAVRFTETIGIRWYGLSYIAGFACAYLLLRWLGKRGLILLPPARAGDAMMTLIVCVLAGGRLGYCLVYDRSLFTHFESSFPFWGVFQIQRGGMASHGGMVGAVIAALRISRGFKNPAMGAGGGVEGRASILHTMDTLALVTPPGLFFGRLANFINGELLGNIVAPPGAGQNAPWWSVQFPQELLTRHAPKLSEEQTRQLEELALRALPQPKPGMFDVWANMPHAVKVELGVMELVEHASRYKAELVPLLSARVPSQLLQAAAEGLVLGAVLWIVAAKPRRAGVIAGLFLLVYGVLRIVTEIWRLPDAQFADGRPMGFSRGQWLSVGMIVAGGLVAWLSNRRKQALAEPQMLGWLRNRSSAASLSQTPAPRSP